MILAQLQMSNFALQQEFSFNASQEQLLRILTYLAENQVNISAIIVSRLYNQDHVKIVPGLAYEETDQKSIQVMKEALSKEGIIFFQNTVITVSLNIFVPDITPPGQLRPGIIEKITQLLTPNVIIYTITLNEGGWLVIGVSHLEEAIKLLGI